ncbi:enoyl-CoA hydratase/isomerase family protein [Sphingobium olei]|uniref:3-hydroxyisobutyryl-CoA hydrolase n=1 Tax=Sphingobium olei TaxID=420955 RepID=A0ABW3P1N9_9SPHN|nr:enoyl-CoA hydratase/isomerase family protein [Sphingobium sp.]
MTQDVLTYVENGIGRIRLNRPKALHALTLPMCQAITAALLDWREDAAISAVMIDHAEGRGFCAGGDIAMIAASAKADCVEAEAFFHAEYRMNHLLFVYEKPIVAFIDGIVMGGGVGLSMPAGFRVATERTIFAMPETGIGLFPDVGGGWFLPRLPGRVGAWLAVTGARIDGADCVAAGIATQYLASDRLDAVKARILADPLGIGEILDENAAPPPVSKLAEHSADIDRLFASDRAEAIVAALRADGGAWAAQQLETIAGKSPQTIKVALRQLALGAGMTSFADNMAMEYDLARAVIRRPDFVEGVRAVIIDKDNSPKWQPATLEAVSDEMLDAIFAERPDRWTPLPELAGAG